MEQEQSAYITSVHLKGYKSIKDVPVTFNKGLNILIGANGSGKTNFLEFLDAAYRDDYKTLLNGKGFECEIQGKPLSFTLEGDRIFKTKLRGAAYKIEKKIPSEQHISTIYFDESKKILKQEDNNTDNIPFNSSSTSFIRFSNPLDSILINKISIHLFFRVKRKILYSNLELKDSVTTFLNNIFYFNDILKTSSNNLQEILSEIIENKFFLIDSLRQNLKQFSPIKDIKIDWTLVRQIILEEEKHLEASSIEGIDFDFFVNNEWRKWTELSDGTKRLFYLIGSVTYATENEIILIEEPELGVHPHQLALLMSFLKAESEDKQIIISTHSPQVLNCLKGEELDRIIVARHEGKVGTKLYHLSEEEKGYASEYMEKESFLSDYWLLSGFMSEQIEETL